MGLFHRHDWSDWSITERGKVVHPVYLSEIIGSYILQERFCRKCGMVRVSQERAGSARTNARLVPEAKFSRAPKKDFA